jgi:cysteine-rich repeat protein
VCGDGDPGPGEECDDGADNSDMNSCKSDCTNNFCGDGAVGPGEGCDDANDDDDDDCTNACALASCGDGDVAPTEQCDDGNPDNTDLCTDACTNAVCSDGFVQPTNSEECDDGVDNADNAACTSSCTAASCGDGAIYNTGDGTEQCDNGAENGPGKACLAHCELNRCGDGDLGPDEQCDDANDMGGDGCTADCKLEACGNDVLDPGEACDDGNAENDDDCTTACKAPVCGDGLLQPSKGETCDLAGQNSDDGACTLACLDAACGDGLIQANVEQCDDAANNGPGKACKADCALNVCGDGDVGPGEACDDGNGSNDDDCTNVCKGASCGDGFKQPGEQCDLGGTNSNNGACTLSCKLPVCGDTFIQPGEQCDDGNQSDTDPCLSTCVDATCGDAKVWQGVEQCDDGNASNNDACTNTCKTASCSDAFKNNAETDIDCGGPTCAKCDYGEMCLVPNDCLSGSCQNNICLDPTSCKQILQQNPQAQSGVYVIDPDGPGGQGPFQTRCDMVASGGGWTLVGSQVNADGRSWTSLATHSSVSAFGDVNTYTTADYKNVGWSTIPARNLLLRTEEYAVGWTNNVLADTAWGPWISSKYNANTCSKSFIGGTPAYSEVLTASQRNSFDIIVRALDDNAACFPTNNENALVSFTLQTCCWTMGLGNTPAGYPEWSTHDQSMLKASSIVPQACNPATYPCNPQGFLNVGTPCYDTSCKTKYASVWVR